MFWKGEKNVQDIIQFIVVILYKVWFLCTTQLLSCTNCDYCTAFVLHKVWFLYTTQLLFCTKSDYYAAVILYKVWLLYITFVKKTITFSNVRLEVKSRKMYYKTSLHSCYLVQTVILVHNYWERNNCILRCKSCSEK